VFLYRAGTGGLVCVSCDASGAQPTGVEAGKLVGGLVSADAWREKVWLAASVPGWTPYAVGEALYQSRYLSDAGRLFFNSSDALVAQDIGGGEDVYEYEPVGVGDCSAGSATYHGVLGGCVGLVSSGVAAGESGFLDASESGNDVFFLTTGRLTRGDVDSAVDVYDAHVCSAGSPCFVEAEVPPACGTADSCRAAPTAQPEIFGAPASSTFSGPGNVQDAGQPKTTRTVVAGSTQKLAKALRACRSRYRKSRQRRVACEKKARKAAHGAHAHAGRRRGR